MDPLSALSIASAVVAFVDLGSNLLSASRRVYKKASGETREEASLQHVANDLAVFSQAIEHELSALQNSQSTSATGKALGQICRECVEAQQELVIAIGKVQASSPKDLDSERNQRKEKKAQSEDRLVVNRLAKALSEIKFDVKFWKSRLDSLRERMTTAILAVLWSVPWLVMAGLYDHI